MPLLSFGNSHQIIRGQAQLSKHLFGAAQLPFPTINQDHMWHLCALLNHMFIAPFEDLPHRCIIVACLYADYVITAIERRLHLALGVYHTGCLCCLTRGMTNIKALYA